MPRVTRDTVQLWLDGETTGIDPNHGDLIEIAWMCRTHQNEASPGFKTSLIIPDHIINSFDPLADFERMVGGTEKFVHDMHTQNKLFDNIEEVIVEATGGRCAPLKPYSIFSVADQILEDAMSVYPDLDWHQGIVICGSSPNFDRSWLLNKLGDNHPICRLISHQVLDVSSLLIHNAVVSDHWDEKGRIVYPVTNHELQEGGQKHRALPDILQSYASWKALCGQGPYVSSVQMEQAKAQMAADAAQRAQENTSETIKHYEERRRERTEEAKIEDAIAARKDGV